MRFFSSGIHSQVSCQYSEFNSYDVPFAGNDDSITMTQQTTSCHILIEPLSPSQWGDLSTLFSQIEYQPYAMLFDSAGSAAGRYHMMMWAPRYVIESKSGHTRVTDTRDNTSQQLALAPLKAVEHYVDLTFAGHRYSTSHPELLAELPFIVGAAGLCGYDLGRYYESLPDTNSDAYVCPDMAIGIFTQSVIYDTRTNELFHCRLASHAPLSEQWPQLARPVSAAPFTLTSSWTSNLSQPAYNQALSRIHQYIVAGDCYQINMAQRFSAGYKGSEWQAYQALRNENQTPFSAFIRLPDSCVLSISPERFLSVREGKVQTKPIKGTRPRHQDEAADQASAQALLAAEKDRAENLMIVDLLRNDLSKHCKPHSVVVPFLFALESYAAVHHLVSTVEGELDEHASPLDLLAGAFPGGSITGTPKIRAMEIIEELEPHRRNVYCGSIMYYGIKKDMDSSITIRTLLAENHTLHCWAGGGIVLDSQAADEYQETLDKVSRILPSLDRFRE